jgi:outer membrane protein TolC
MVWKRRLAWAVLCAAGSCGAGWAQNPPENTSPSTPVILTLKRSIGLALENSKDIQLAKLQVRVAENSAAITRASFLPNLYLGSGGGYTYGLPDTPGGQPPAIFRIIYREEVYNGPLRGLEKQQYESVKAQRVALEDTRSAVIDNVATSYLELVKVRHSLELLRAEKESAERILNVTQEREKAGYEFPTDVTKAQLTEARIVERILDQEGREDQLEVYLRGQLGLPPDQPIEVTPEELPGPAEQEGANLVAMAMQNNTNLQFAESTVKGDEFRLAGEKKGKWPTLELVSVYDVLLKYNFRNYTDIINHFTYNNLNAGINLNVPIFSSTTRANIALAQASLDAAKINLAVKRTQVSADVRQRSRKVQQADAAKEVRRLELQLSQQSLQVVQSQLNEGKMNLADVERARLDENEKWMAYLDALFARQQAQLELLRVAGQIEKALE